MEAAGQLPRSSIPKCGCVQGCVRWSTGHTSELERSPAAAETEERRRAGRRQSELGRGRFKHGQRPRCERTGRGGSRRHGGTQRRNDETAVFVTSDRWTRRQPLRSVGGDILRMQLRCSV